MRSFKVQPCSRDFSDQDLWCSVCDSQVVKLNDETTGEFFSHFGTVRSVSRKEDGEYKSHLKEYEQFVWACCNSCLEKM